MDTGHCGLETCIIALDYCYKVSHSCVFCGKLVLNIFRAGLNCDECVPMMMGEIFKGEVSMYLPHSCL